MRSRTGPPPRRPRTPRSGHANGDVTERFRYGDYGNREALTAAGSPSGSTELCHGFTGRLHDDLVGLIEYRHRWMQPGTGTFVQREPDRC